jgi:hypothetical protein
MEDEANGVDFKAFCAQFHADLPFNVTAKSPATGSRYHSFHVVQAVSSIISIH